MKDLHGCKLKILTILVRKKGQQENSCGILQNSDWKKTDNIAFYTIAQLKKYHFNTQGDMASSFSTKL